MNIHNVNMRRLIGNPRFGAPPYQRYTWAGTPLNVLGVEHKFLFWLDDTLCGLNRVKQKLHALKLHGLVDAWWPN